MNIEPAAVRHHRLTHHKRVAACRALKYSMSDMARLMVLKFGVPLLITFSQGKRMRVPILTAVLAPFFLTALSTPSSTAADPKAFPDTPTKWNGFARHDFKVDGTEAIVVVPEKPLPGRPWVWRGESFDAFTDADVALVKAGWHLAYLKVPDLFGSAKAVTRWERFHGTMVSEYSLHPKPGLIGLSRGALYCLNWAAAHPDRTLAVYLDNAVCDFKSWPGGKPKGLGTGKGSADEWQKLLAAYGFKDDTEAVAFKFNPVDHLAPLAKAKIPLLLVYGDADTVVPAKENSELIYERYKKLGGPIERVVKPGQDHHPHGLKDVAPVVAFFTHALGASK
jgi:pimeloyl-ACP methyl ester carboxylesterase